MMFSMIVMMDNSTFEGDSSWLCGLYLVYVQVRMFKQWLVSC